MDLLREVSGLNKVVVARHISADKTFPVAHNAINRTALCYSYSHQPDFESYFIALSPYIWVLWICGLAVLMATCILFVVTIRAAWQHWRQSSTNVTVVLAVYPIVASSAFLAIVLPRCRILAEAIAQEAVMIAMCHLYSMIITECGGPDQLIRRSSDARLETRVLPCCCWPCCLIPRPKLQKRSLVFMKCLVMQMPVIQALIYVVLLALLAEDMMIYHESSIYFQPFIAASILTGVWGVIMCVRMAETAGHRVRPRFLAIQLALIIVKVQSGFAKFLPELIEIPCVSSINPSVFINMIQNGVMLLEMLLLSIWAWRLYRVAPGKNLDRPQVVVAVLDDSIKPVDPKTMIGLENKSFNERYK
ncbi:organic solute transporter alpha-like protein [Bombyx mori]|uniref:Organic solute transporter alpha-like protein n=2 Tax=Bombyx mori TaxID=7091 RepID=A0A8R2AMA4_BOMMO|nr:organic solute transporter alpha-like protein isoform X1 [Bombyx mori]